MNWSKSSHDKVLATKCRYLILFPFENFREFFLSFFTYSYLLLSKWDFEMSLSVFWGYDFPVWLTKAFLYFLSLLSERWVHLICSWCSQGACSLSLLLLTFWTWPWDGPEITCIYLAKVVISTFMVCWFYWAHSYTSWIISPHSLFCFYFESNSPSPFRVDIHWHSPNGFLALVCWNTGKE